MELRLVQDLQYLKFPDLPRRGITVARGLTLTSDKEAVRTLLDQHFMPALGPMLRHEQLCQYAHLIFEGRFPQIARMTHEEAKYEARMQLARSQHFLQALWLLRDNSGNAGPVYLAAHHEDTTNNWSHESSAVWYCRSDCRLEDSSFSQCELRRMMRLYAVVDRLTPRTAYETFQSRGSGIVFRSRIARALYTSQMARSISDVVVKIAHYCISFESLFSTDTAGVAHRVSERVANFVGANAEDKRLIFRDVKHLYDVRSTFVHGSHAEPKEEAKRLVLSSRADHLLRHCIRKVLRDHDLRRLFSSGSQKEVQEYFFGRLFSD